MNERDLSDNLSQFLDNTGSDAATPVDLDAGLALAAARLAALPDLLPKPEPAFERQVWSRLRRIQNDQPARRRWSWSVTRPLRLRWLLPVAGALLVILLVLPGPRQVLGDWMARFSVGDVQVVVSPEVTSRPVLASREDQFDSLADAAQAAGYALLEPAYLPPGYHLSGVTSVSFDQLPVWMQPLFVEASYRPDDAQTHIGYYAVLREYTTARSGQTGLDAIEFQAEAVHAASDVVLGNGQRGVLLEFEPDEGDDRVVLRQIIWEQDGMTLELWSQVLPPDEMMRIAESVQ